MSKRLRIVIGLTIAATVVPAAQAQTSPIQRIIAQENAKSVAARVAQARFAQANANASSPGVADRIVDDYFRDAATPSQASAGIADDSWRGPTHSAYGNPTPAVVVVADSAFDWADAGIGSAAAFALTLLAAGGIALRRDSRRQKVHG